MRSEPDKLLKKHQQLIQTDHQKVSSHVQREKDGWILHTLMIEGCDVPFKFKRIQKYKSLKGQRVNLTYYAAVETVAGLEMDIFNVVRIKVS